MLFHKFLPNEFIGKFETIGIAYFLFFLHIYILPAKGISPKN